MFPAMPYQDPFSHPPAEQSNRFQGYDAEAFSNQQVPHPPGEDASGAFFQNASAPRINSSITIYNALKRAHPDVEIITSDPNNARILEYINTTGDGEIQSTTTIPDIFHPQPSAESMEEFRYIAPYRRLDGGNGAIVSDPLFKKYLVKWKNQQFLIYIVDHRDGTNYYPQKRQFILTSDTSTAYTLLKTVGYWSNTLHGEIWVFNQGFWQKDQELWRAIQKSNWEDIILPKDLKEDLLTTVTRFYDSRDQYLRHRVPWKRGLIFYGPPGNGKTVSIKATMKTLYDRKEPIPTLYVKSLASFAGPEFSINQIFARARQEAPCYLVFEDLDSLVTDRVRSFFLNAVDGLGENDGILMIGSTNHLDRLDPGIAKRPSRFDRKYLFDDPDEEQREKYCQYWQKKLNDVDEVEFPDILVNPIANLMNGFSFAYMQEAFVSTLLKIVNDKQHG